MTKNKGERKPTKTHSKTPNPAGSSKKVSPVVDNTEKKSKQFDHHDFGKSHQTAGKHHHVVKTKAESGYDHIGQDLLKAAAKEKTDRKNHHHKNHPTAHHGGGSPKKAQEKTNATVTAAKNPASITTTRPQSTQQQSTN